MVRLAIKSLACCLALGLCVVLGPVGLASAQSVVRDDAWEVVEKHGSVRFRAPAASQWSQAAVGAKLPLGSRIVTDADGWVLIRHPAGNLWVEPNARFVLPTPDEAAVRQEVGHLRYRVIRAEQQRFEVETPYASLVVKGTAFGVRVTDAEVMVEVARGWVDVATRAGARADLRGGQAARVSGGAAPTLEVRPGPGQAFEPVPADRQAMPAIAPAVRPAESSPGNRDAGAGEADEGASWWERFREMLLNSPPPTPREDWWGPGDGGDGHASSGGSGSRGSSGGSGSSGSGGGSGSSGSGGDGDGDDDDDD